jgi:hypothetical protein
MSLKDAVTNSLLMFVAATCVVLIVKSIPQTKQGSQAEASSTNGDLAIPKNSGAPTIAMQDGVKVYYLHGNVRCPTCRSIEAYAKEAVETGFPDELENQKIQWQVINYESPGNEHYATDYQVVAPNVVLVKIKDGKQNSWKRLPEVWEHVGNKATFINFVQNSLKEFLGEPKTDSSSSVGTVQSQIDNESPPLPLPE